MWTDGRKEEGKHTKDGKDEWNQGRKEQRKGMHHRKKAFITNAMVQVIVKVQ